jgi:hypothetical protein
MLADPALTALWPQDRSSGLHVPSLPDVDFRNRASSNVLSNIVSECGSTDFVEDLFRLQAEAADDDFFLDFGGAAEDARGPLTCGHPVTYSLRQLANPGRVKPLLGQSSCSPCVTCTRNDHRAFPSPAFALANGGGGLDAVRGLLGL